MIAKKVCKRKTGMKISQTRTKICTESFDRDDGKRENATKIKAGKRDKNEGGERKKKTRYLEREDVEEGSRGNSL